ncbi:MAG: DUF2075 domain-containing protein [Prolixibacteraceae bacterium]
MIVYKNTSKGFIDDVESNVIDTRIKEAFLSSFNRKKVNDKEETSWSNSMQFMGNVIRKANVADDCGILIEYNLPSTSLRVDFIISGRDENNRSSFIIVELKQWKEAESTKKDGVVKTPYHPYDTHPSYQAFSYKLFLKDYNQAIYNSNIQVFSCAYLHNYMEKNPEPLKDNIYKKIVNDSPIYFKKDQKQLEHFIKKYVGNGKGENILYQIENGNIKPSKKLIDHISSLFQGNSAFILLDDQKIAFETAKDIALNSKGNGKTVVIINGGPGTGKSVVSMNLLGSLIKKGKNAIFVAPNASFRSVMADKLTKQHNNRVQFLLKGSSSFYGARKNTFDVLIVDEAHRLKNDRAFMYKGKNQVEDIINAARVSIFFIDEKQIIRPEDIGTINEICRIAEQNSAEVHRVDLHAQFRCTGAEGYVNWINDVLHIEETGNYDGWDNQDFDFKIFDDPNALRKAIKVKAKNGFDARILAGYAWKWTSAKVGNANSQIDDVTIPEYNFSMPWNSRQVGSTWAIDKSGIDQVGCVHTSQGLEFDYVGIIIGNDLQFNFVTKEYFTNWNDYKDSKGKEGLKKNPDELNSLVRNVYRILFTRGMKGCYVCFVNKETKKYFKERLNTTV